MGDVQPESICDMTTLQEVFLDNNKLFGALLIRAHAVIRGPRRECNRLSGRTTMPGTIPDCFSRLTRVNSLELSDNQLYGSIPTGLGSMSSLQ